MISPTLTPAEYRAAKAVCDKAAAYWQANATFTRGGWSSLSADLAKHPDYAACTNDLRGRVEQFELLTDTPAALSAYIGSPVNGRYPVTTWTGDLLGYATCGNGWRINRMWEPLYQFRATINGRQFTGRGKGSGMCINLRETAASKRTAIN